MEHHGVVFQRYGNHIGGFVDVGGGVVAIERNSSVFEGLVAEGHISAGVLGDFIQRERGLNVGINLVDDVDGCHNVGVDGFVKHGFDHLALPFGAAVIVIGIAVAAIGEGLDAGEGLHARPFQIGIVVTGFFVDIADVLIGPIDHFAVFHIDVDAAQSVNAVDQAIEIDDDIITDVHVKVLVDGLDGLLGAAVHIGRVDFVVVFFVVAAGGNAHVKVPHDGGDLNIAFV